MMPKNPQGGSASSSSGEGGNRHNSMRGRNNNKSSKAALPPLFWYMEMGDWNKATERAKRHPREVKTWATLRTKSMDNSSNSGKVSGTKRLALHHACFKLRSATTDNDTTNNNDPFVEVCRFILLLITLYPEAAGMRESRHGCLPLHLAAFASCAPRVESSSASEAEQQQQSKDEHDLNANIVMSVPLAAPPIYHKNDDSVSLNAAAAAATLRRPTAVSRQERSVSDNTHDTSMTSMMAEERYTGHQTMQQATATTATTQQQQHRRSSSVPTFTRVSQKHSFLISNRRQELAVQVLNALLDAYPKGIRVDSEGGRLPLHTACAGRATPRVISTLLTAYPAAARHRNKDGFLPLHLSAHWGVSHPNVAITLLKTYPDATVGRNRWERTPLEEALCMAGENGRPHQAALVRALRKHPSYWTKPPAELFSSSQARRSHNIVDMDETIDDTTTTQEEQDEHYYKAVGDVDGLEQPKHRFTLFGKGRGVDEQRKQAPPSQDLATLIKAQNWDGVIARLELEPNEASEHLKLTTRGGFVALSGLTPLAYACERRPPAEVIEALLEASPEAATTRVRPGGALPLHIACTWHASHSVVSLLLATEPASCRIPDGLGNLPLHSACFSGASATIVDGLLRTFPKSILVRNNQGSLASDIVQRLRHENRRQVKAILDTQMELVRASQHRRGHSSDSFSSVAKRAAELNAREDGETGYLETTARGSSNSSSRDGGGVGVEVVPLDDAGEEMVWI